MRAEIGKAIIFIWETGDHDVSTTIKRPDYKLNIKTDQFDELNVFEYLNCYVPDDEY